MRSLIRTIRTSPRAGAYKPLGAGLGDRLTVALGWAGLGLLAMVALGSAGAIASGLRLKIPETAAPPTPPPRANPPNINNCRRLIAIIN